MIKSLFISDEKFIGTKHREGGVQFCTNEYISVLSHYFNLKLFAISPTRKIFNRILVKLGLDAYDLYSPEEFFHNIKKILDKDDIRIVFLNLGTSIKISKYLKESNPKLRVILCSHGNESGDFINEIDKDFFFRKKLLLVFKRYKLGKQLNIEKYYRDNFLDLVVTVSDIEVAIEKWLGAKLVYFLPRVLSNQFTHWTPVHNVVGFLGDLTHLPNYLGIISVCENISKLSHDCNIKIEIIGRYNEFVKSQLNKFKFVHLHGYIDDPLPLIKNWCYFINPLFYYSKGVTTKLGKAISLGIPVISTEPGNRGYVFEDADIPTYNRPDKFCEKLITKLKLREYFEDKLRLDRLVLKSYDSKHYAKELRDVILNIR